MFKSLKEKAKRVSEAAIENGYKDKLSNINLSKILAITKDTDTPDERTLTEKLKSASKKVGEELFILVFKSYLAMTDSKTEAAHKAILAAGVAYFVLPIDLIPDMLVGVGYTDDAAALALTAKNVGDAITDEHEGKAKDKWNSFFKKDVQVEKLEEI